MTNIPEYLDDDEELAALNDEPIYIAAGDEFDMEDNSWRYPDGFKDTALILRAFDICGHRKYFKSQKESRLWKKIDSQASKRVIFPEWIGFCLKWAEKKNTPRCIINVEALGHLILNKARMNDFMREKNSKEHPRS